MAASAPSFASPLKRTSSGMKAATSSFNLERCLSLASSFAGFSH